ncbi:MAG: hypothetical protein FWF35_04375 [Elusimicrobia bacterium]|nr:hypothetical protein [Elusimicrobiota bacterium]
MERIKNILGWISDFPDPYRQSFFFFKYKLSHVIIIIAAVLFVYSFHVTKITYASDYSKGFIHSLFDNDIVYLPNYLIHEFSHTIVGNMADMLLPVPDGCYDDNGMCLARWIRIAAGNGMETLVPIILLLLLLRLKGGGMLTPPLLYWISTTIYGAAEYASDARAQNMALTGSDFLSHFKPGEANGDWYFILKPLGLLNYDIVVGRILFLLAAFCFVMAVYSAYYYFTHLEEITKRGIAGGDWNKKEEKAEINFGNIYNGPPSEEEPAAPDTENKMPRL